MRRLTFCVGLGCGLALLLFFYRSALFRGEQFGFRDSAHYYYPLYHKVQEEWNAGRLPLWDPSENAGMPLLGNPTAAVLYPGKVIYAAFSYAWAARLYVAAHSVLAFAGMLVLMRSWGTSWVGSAIAGLAYTFGGPVVFQYCNIIFLVGAAWIPWGLLAVDRWLRLGRPGAIAGLAVVLAMQVLGGDPESAYLTGLCAGGYAIGLTRVSKHGPWKVRPGVWVPVVLVGIVAWVVITLVMAAKLPGFRPEPSEKPWGPISRWFASGTIPVFRQAAFPGPVSSLPWTPWVPRIVAGIWVLVGLRILANWRKRGSSASPLIPKLGGLAAAAMLAGALSAAQMVPAVEFTGLSGRATDEGAHDIYPFSLEPYRLLELGWPGVFGRNFGRPVNWSDLLMQGQAHRVWVPSLYLGGITAVLALGAIGFRGGPPWRAWLTGIAVVSVIGSFGEFASPLAYARYNPTLAKALGPHDAKETNAVRLDGYLRDGDGSPYFLMAELLPGFQQFRFPSKLLSFTALAVAGLGGLGWDRAIAGRSRRASRLAVIGSGMTLVVLAAVFALREPIMARLDAPKFVTMFGPLDSKETSADIQAALIHGAAIMAATYGLLSLGRRRADLAGVLALLVLCFDIALVNPMLIKTVPQDDFELNPKVLKLIAEAERLDPSPGPYRIHRMPTWTPSGWLNHASKDRAQDMVRWEHDTIQPKYGMLHGVDYTQAIGVAELYDYSWFFAPFPRGLNEDAAAILRLPPGDSVVVYPRKGFDLWNSRYFIIPGLPRWDVADRGFASFLLQTSRIYPATEIFTKAAEPAAKQWMETEDYQILRNHNVYPRAWIVHNALFRPPISGLTRSTRQETMLELLFANDPFWSDRARKPIDLHELAWIEADIDDQVALARYLPGGPPLAGESVQVVTAESNPQRVVLDATLARPGLVILSEVVYPGWKLTIDDQPSPIIRANRLMRAAAVSSGKHRLVYTYEPRSFQVGAVVSIAAIIVLVAFSIWSFRRGRSLVA